MNKMTASQFLARTLSLNNLIESTKETIERLSPPHCTIGGGGSHTPGNTEPDRQIKRHELAMKMEKYTETLTEYNDALFDIIASNDVTTREKILLQQRYMLSKSWKEVAEVLQSPLETVFSMDKRIKSKLNKKTDYWRHI